jgi:hypothetical protein
MDATETHSFRFRILLHRPFCRCCTSRLTRLPKKSDYFSGVDGNDHALPMHWQPRDWLTDWVTPASLQHQIRSNLLLSFLDHVRFWLQINNYYSHGHHSFVQSNRTIPFCASHHDGHSLKAVTCYYGVSLVLNVDAKLESFRRNVQKYGRTLFFQSNGGIAVGRSISIVSISFILLVSIYTYTVIANETVRARGLCHSRGLGRDVVCASGLSHNVRT